VLQCDNNGCRYCISGNCVANVVKMWTIDVGPDEADLVCQTFESKHQEGDS